MNGGSHVMRYLCIPRHGHVFVRGLGWVPVAVRPTRPRPVGLRWQLDLLHRAARARRRCTVQNSRRTGCRQQWGMCGVPALGGLLCAAREGGGWPSLLMKASREAAVVMCRMRLAGICVAALDKRAATASRVVGMRMGVDVTRMLAECGQCPFANRRRYMQEVTFRFHNVQGMRSERTGREAYLRAACDMCDVLVLAETNCPCDVAVQREWGQSWVHGYEPVWASDGEGRVGRGMAVFVSKRLPQAAPRLVCADPLGRFVAVNVTVFGRATLVVGVHADNGDDAEQEAFYDRVRATLPPVVDGTDVIWLGDMNNVEGRALDYTRYGTQLGPAGYQPRARGIAAMQTLGASLGGVCDAFRMRHALRREYTHVLRQLARVHTWIGLMSHRTWLVVLVHHLWLR